MGSFPLTDNLKYEKVTLFKIPPRNFSDRKRIYVQKSERRDLKKEVLSNIVLETKPKRFGIVPKFLLLKTDSLDFVQNLLSWPKYKGSPSIRKNSIVFCFSPIGYRNVWNVCSFTVLILLEVLVLTGIWQRVGSQWAASNCRLVRLEGAALLLTTPSQPTTPNNNAHSRI
jgi:hypothetical protein